MRSWVDSQAGGQIVAGGALTGSFTGQIDNVSIRQYGTVAGSSVPGANSGSVTSVGTGQVAPTVPGGHSGRSIW